ncbi:MAG: sll1863 family stress response protein, partial [Pseudobdellovibrionaceae bacterium]
KISEEIADLKKDAKTASGKLKNELNQEISLLEKKQKSLQKDFTHWKKSTGKAWEEMKNGMSQAMDNISDSYQKAKKEFSETKAE